MSTKKVSGRGRKVAVVGIRLLFKHSTIDPATITHTLGLQPCRQVRVGERDIGIDGKPLQALAQESAWSFWLSYYDEKESVGERMAAVLKPLLQHASFVRELTSEGRAEIILEFPGQRYLGCDLSPTVLQMIVDLGLALGIEVFPDSAT